jgi:hypothetical protein
MQGVDIAGINGKKGCRVKGKTVTASTIFGINAAYGGPRCG